MHTIGIRILEGHLLPRCAFCTLIRDDTSANLEGALRGGYPNCQIRLMLLCFGDGKRRGLGCLTSGSELQMLGALVLGIDRVMLSILVLDAQIA